MNIEVAYLDGRGGEKVNFVQFFTQPPDEGEEIPVLLYRSVDIVNILLLLLINFIGLVTMIYWNVRVWSEVV